MLTSIIELFFPKKYLHFLVSSGVRSAEPTRNAFIPLLIKHLSNMAPISVRPWAP